MSSQHVTYDFDRPIDRRHDAYSYSQKWSCAKALAQRLGVKEIIDNHIALFTADMDLRCAQPILDALHATVDHGIFGYSTLDGCSAYTDAIHGWFERHDRWDVDCDLMSLSAGTVKALDVCVQAFTKPGDGVIIQRPVYPPCMHVVEDNDRMILNNQLIRHTAKDPEGDLYYSIDFDNLEELAARPEAKMFILCNPHNPVGRVWSVEELERMAQICMRHDVLIVADEIHGDLVCEGITMHHMAQVAPEARVITCTAVNKTFNLAGLIGSYHIIYNSWLKDRIDKESSLCHYNDMNVLSMHALIGAYKPEGHEWVDELCEVLTENVNIAYDFFSNIDGIDTAKPEGTYMLFLDCKGWCTAHNQTLEDLYKKGQSVGVYWQDGRPFHNEYGIRVNLALPKSRVEEALNRFRNYVFCD